MSKTRNTILRDRNPVARLRLFVVLFFVSVLLPLSVIVFYGYQQFENEMYFQYRWKSSNALKQINKTLLDRLAVEEMRSVDHYSFYRNVANPVEMGSSREVSPLAQPMTYAKDIGLIGYFRIDTNGKLNIPLLPYQTSREIAAAKIEMQWDEVERRLSVRKALEDILVAGGMLSVAAQGTTEGDNQHRWQPRRMMQGSADSGEQKIDPFQIQLVGMDHLVFYRNVWQDQRRVIQGFIVSWQAYFSPLLHSFVDLGYYDNCVQVRFSDVLSAPESADYFRYYIDENGVSSVQDFDQPQPALEKKFIYEGNFSTPFSQLNLRFTTDRLPMGPASEFVGYVLVVLLFVIVAGCMGFYRLGLKQIALAEQRMNFVSSVSHELKTPLTSILMYSEMLKSGMVQTAETQFDYHNFIYHESSRLSRLINNILQLSSFGRHENSIQTDFISVNLLQDTIRSKLSSMIAENSFTLNFHMAAEIEEKGDVEARVDLDAFTQIVINLADNAVKFFAAAKIEDETRRQLDVSFNVHQKSDDKLVFSVRDYGPGISKEQSEKIFELFYRCGNEMTRTAPGTGIGLALVNELVIAQGGEIKVKRYEQGVAFEITFECRRAS